MIDSLLADLPRVAVLWAVVLLLGLATVRVTARWVAVDRTKAGQPQIGAGPSRMAERGVIPGADQGLQPCRPLSYAPLDESGPAFVRFAAVPVRRGVGGRQTGGAIAPDPLRPFSLRAVPRGGKDGFLAAPGLSGGAGSSGAVGR